MIRKLLVAIGFLFLLNAATAQRFDAGLIAGFNASQVEGDKLKGYHKPGFLAGAFVQTDIAPAIVAGFEIKYSQKGARRKFKPQEGLQDPKDKYVMRLGYIDLPLFVGFRTNDRSMLIGGIAPGILVHSKELDSVGEIPEQYQQEFNTFDLQPFVGFQFDFLERVSLDLRMALSVVKAADLPGDSNYYFHTGLYNNVISLALYYNL